MYLPLVLLLSFFPALFCRRIWWGWPWVGGRVRGQGTSAPLAGCPLAFSQAGRCVDWGGRNGRGGRRANLRWRLGGWGGARWRIRNTGQLLLTGWGGRRMNISLVMVVVVMMIIATADHDAAWLHHSHSSFTQQFKKLRRQQVTTSSSWASSSILIHRPLLFSTSWTQAGGGRRGRWRGVMQRLGVGDLLCCSLNTLTPCLASVRQPRQRATLQNIQKLWFLLQAHREERIKDNVDTYNMLNVTLLPITWYVRGSLSSPSN